MDEKRILIIEDELKVAMALCRALVHPVVGGYQVDVCPLADVAMKRLRYEQFDLIVTDLQMPGMNGLDLLRHVRQTSPQTAVILITGFGTPDVEKQAHQLGAVYLPKPFSLQDFINTAHRTLMGERECGEVEEPIVAGGGLEAIIQ
jgi:DNA-binding response OmpR family regulator